MYTFVMLFVGKRPGKWKKTTTNFSRIFGLPIVYEATPKLSYLCVAVFIFLLISEMENGCHSVRICLTCIYNTQLYG